MPKIPSNKGPKVTTASGKGIGPIDVKPVRPSWPVLEPAIPQEDLILNHLVPRQIVTISPFWSASLCRKYVSFLTSLPLTTTNGTPKRGDAVRVNDRFQIDDPGFSHMLWETTGLKETVMAAQLEGYTSQELWGGEVLGLNPNIRVYRYRRGQFFDQHCKKP